MHSMVNLIREVVLLSEAKLGGFVYSSLTNEKIFGFFEPFFYLNIKKTSFEVFDIFGFFAF